MEDSVQEVFNLIKKYPTIVLFGHYLPDGDCYGSQIALREILRATYPDKKVYAVGSGLPIMFDRLGAMDVIDDKTVKGSLGILVDVSDFPLVEDKRYVLASQIAKIDHHYENSEFAHPKILDREVIATAELIARIALKEGLKITKRGAEAIFLGIVTDSGRFLYSPTRKETFQIIAQLYDYGLETKPIYDIIYQTQENQLKYKGFLLSHYQKTSHNVIYCYTSKDDYLPLGLDFAYASSQVNVLANIQNCPVFALFTQSEDGALRVELRSNTIPIRDVAVKHGGGGHANAAGVRMNVGGYQEAMKIVEDLDELVKEK